ncbi:MAG: OprO/OprP family phosphate-selective porin [Erythrobacter sp.]
MLLSATAGALCFAQPAMAQDNAAMAQELAEMRAAMAAMAQRIDALESELAEAEAKAEVANTQAATASQAAAAASAAAEKAAKSPTIAFKGAPEIKADGGWSFKPRGRLQYDTGFVDAPDSTGREDGWSTNVRRVRLGVQGTMPGGFGYKAEVDFANNEVAVTDAYLSYEAGDLEISAGQFNNFQSLEELTSSLHTSFIERAAFTDAFGFIRTVGVGVQYGKGDVLLQGGVFTDNMERLPSRNWSLDGRAVYMPKLGDAQLHLGGSFHRRWYEDGSTVRYRQRPLVAITDERFINTGNLAADSETAYGLEAAFISGPFHAAAEGHWQEVSRPGALTNPTFFGGYAEVGYFFTKGDTRGYKEGMWDRTKPANPVGKGGMGSLQLNLRYDVLDLSDAGILGGKQDGYYIALAWKPTDYTMLLANYAKLDYTGAVYAAAGGDRDYAVDAFGLRAQIDF